MPLQECTSSARVEGTSSDATIRNRPEEILALKLQRNQYAPISRLPVEILTEIFLIVRQLTEDTKKCSGCRRLDWIRVSHVTTTWRSIALDFIRLWIEPPFWNTQWAEEMVRRSKGVALTIRHSFSKGSSLRSRQFLQETMKRGENVNELQLNHLLKEHVGIIPTQLSRATNIFLKCEYLHTPLPADILSAASKLRVLSPAWCEIDLVSCLPHSITTLKLYRVHIPSPSTITQFFDALKNLSSLEVLHLYYMTGSFEIPHSSRTINLASLRQLSVTSSMAHAAMLFRHVVVPTNMISLCVQTRENSDESLGDFLLNTKDMLAAIGRIYADNSSNITFRALSLGQLSFDFFVDDVHFLPSFCPLSLDIDTPCPVSSFAMQILTMMCSSGIPMDNINTVQFENNMPNYTGEYLAQTLGRLPNVYRIKSNDVLAHESLVEAIQMPADVEELYFSNLSVLEFNDLEFEPDHNVDDDFLNKLRDCLMCRCEYGAEIIKLVLEDCPPNKYVGELLEQIVVDVEWHGDFYGTEEDYSGYTFSF